MALGAAGGILGAATGGALGRAIVEVVGDSSKLQADLAKAKAQTASATTQMGKQTSKFSALSTGAYVAIGTAAVAGIGFAIKAASDLGEQMNRVKVVFEDSADSVIKFSETSAAKLGLAQSAALEGAASFGALFDAAGLAEQAGAKMSIRLVTLAADMASFNNQDPSEMLIRLRAGLSGEAEPLRRFGVFIDEARVKAEAYASGIAEVGEELTIQQKIQARFNVIMQDTAKQQGDFARTVGESLPNQLRVLKASLTDTAAGLGQVLLPVLTTVVKAMVSFLPVIKPVTVSLVALAGAFLLVKAAAGISTLLVSIGAALQSFVILQGVGAAVGNFGIALSGLATGPVALVAASLVSLYLIIKNVGAAFEGLGRSVAEALPPEFYDALGAAAAGTVDLTGKTEELTTAQEENAGAARELLAAELALTGGFVGIAAAVDGAADSERTLTEARRELAKLTKEGKKGTDEYRAAQEAVDDAARNSLQSQVSLAGAVQKYAEEVEKGEISQKDAIARVREFGEKAGLSAGEISTLVGQVKSAIREYGKVPQAIETQVRLNNSEALRRLNDLQGKYRSIKNEIEGTITIGVKPGPLDGRNLHPGPLALGGIIAGQAGFITKGPTMLVGESRKMTFAGKGAEAVIPFDNRGIGILAKALEKAGSGGGESVTNLYLNVQVEHAYGDNLEQIVVGALGRAADRYGLR